MGRIRNAILDRQYEMEAAENEAQEEELMNRLEFLTKKLDHIQGSIEVCNSSLCHANEHLRDLLKMNKKVENKCHRKKIALILGGIAAAMSICYLWKDKK